MVEKVQVRYPVGKGGLRLEINDSAALVHQDAAGKQRVYLVALLKGDPFDPVATTNQILDLLRGFKKLQRVPACSRG